MNGPSAPLPITESPIEVDAKKGETPELDCAKVDPTPSTIIVTAAKPSDSIIVVYLIVLPPCRPQKGLAQSAVEREFPSL